MWHTSLRETIPTELLLKRHYELLNKRDREIIVVGEGFAREVKIIDKGVDVQAVTKGLELGYKLYGKLTGDEPKAPPPKNVYNMFFLPEVQKSVKSFEDAIKAQIINNDAQTNTQQNKTVDVEAEGSEDSHTDAGGTA